MSIAGVMGEQQIELAQANKWYVIVAPAEATDLQVELSAAGRYSIAIGITHLDAVPAWGSAGVRGITVPADTGASDEVPYHRRIAVASDGGSSYAGITFTRKRHS